MENAFCHIELNSNDPGKAKDFYGELFSWKFEDYPMPEGTYTMLNPGKDPQGGIFKNPVPGIPSHWLVYIQVEDIVESTEKAKQLGAKVHKDITDIPDMGRFSVIEDPTGAVAALWQSVQKK